MRFSLYVLIGLTASVFGLTPLVAEKYFTVSEISYSDAMIVDLQDVIDDGSGNLTYNVTDAKKMVRKIEVSSPKAPKRTKSYIPLGEFHRGAIHELRLSNTTGAFSHSYAALKFGRGATSKAPNIYEYNKVDQGAKVNFYYYNVSAYIYGIVLSYDNLSSKSDHKLIITHEVDVHNKWGKPTSKYDTSFVSVANRSNLLIEVPFVGSGNDSISLGSDNVASGTASIALGTNNNSIGSRSVALGYGNDSEKNGSVALGWNNRVTNSYATAIGKNNTASGLYSVALGNASEATNSNAFAAGNEAKALGNSSIAMGDRAETTNSSGAIALGKSAKSHATGATSIGWLNTASGSYSTAMGFNNKATQTNSMAIGWSNTAEGHYSSAFGLDNKTNGRGQFVVGEYNKVVGQGASDNTIDALDYMFIVGNGNGDADRSNAFTVQRNGIAVFTGKVIAKKDLNIKGDIEAEGTITIPQRGDVLMGIFQ